MYDGIGLPSLSKSDFLLVIEAVGTVKLLPCDLPGCFGLRSILPRDLSRDMTRVGIPVEDPSLERLLPGVDDLDPSRLNDLVRV